MNNSKKSRFSNLREVDAKLDEIDTQFGVVNNAISEGGQGSGNFGHSGIPGHQGGSGSGGSSPKSGTKPPPSREEIIKDFTDDSPWPLVRGKSTTVRNVYSIIKDLYRGQFESDDQARKLAADVIDEINDHLRKRGSRSEHEGPKVTLGQS